MLICHVVPSLKPNKFCIIFWKNGNGSKTKENFKPKKKLNDTTIGYNFKHGLKFKYYCALNFFLFSFNESSAEIILS